VAAELAGDVWMLQQVDFTNQEETAPCFVMLCFFLQDMGDLNRHPIRGSIRRLLPNRAPALSPRSLGSNGDGTPCAGCHRARDPNDAGDGNQPMPDANQSNGGGGGGGWFGRHQLASCCPCLSNKNMWQKSVVKVDVQQLTRVLVDTSLVFKQTETNVHRHVQICCQQPLLPNHHSANENSSSEVCNSANVTEIGGFAISTLISSHPANQNSF